MSYDIITAEGPLAIAEDRLINSLVATDEYKAWVGEDTEERARWHAHHDELPPPANDADEYSEQELKRYLPYTLVWTHDGRDGVPGLMLHQDSADSSARYTFSGWLVVEFVRELSADEVHNARRANRRFKNEIGNIIMAIAQLSGTGNINYLAFNDAQWIAYGRLPDEHKLTDRDCHHGLLGLHWGVRRK